MKLDWIKTKYRYDYVKIEVEALWLARDGIRDCYQQGEGKEDKEVGELSGGERRLSLRILER
jgi:hypothetical protein